MSTRDQVSSIAIEESLDPLIRTGAANGAGVDTREFDSVTFLLRFGAVADGFFTFVPQESDDDVTFTDISSDDLIGTPPTSFGGSPASGAATATPIGYKGDSRYVRVRVEQGLSPAPATGAECGGAILLGNLHQSPGS